MTNAQIQMSANKETARANKAKEAETARANRAKEKETYRSNKAQEHLTKRGQDFKLGTDVAGTVVKGLGTIAGIANDPKFYTKDNEALIQATIPTNFNVPLGLPITPGVDEALPGITTIVLQNSVGNTYGDPSDAVNKMSSMLFTAIQAHTNYTKTYQQADLTMMILAQREIIATLHHAAKIMRITKTYSTQNTYYGDYVLKALNIDPVDMKENYANYKKRLLILAQQASQLYIPSIPLMDRTAQVYGSWFREKATDAQDDSRMMSYLFKPFTFGVFDIDEASSAGGIHYMRFGYSDLDGGTGWLPTENNQHVFKDILDAIQLQINQILTDDNFKFISGDVARTFSKFFSAVEIDVDSKQIPAYDEYSLAQIHNIATIPNFETNIWGTLTPTAHGWGLLGDMSDHSLNIEQDPRATGMIICTPSFNLGYRMLASTAAEVAAAFENIMAGGELETDKSKPSTDYVIDASRFVAGYSFHLEATAAVEPGYNVSVDVVHCGTEIPVIYQVWELERVGNDRRLVMTNLTSHAYNDATTANTSQARNAMSIGGTQFLNNSPSGVILRYYVPFTTRTANNVAAAGRSGNIRNLRFFDSDTIGYMHLAAAMSLFGVTSLFKELLSLGK